MGNHFDYTVIGYTDNRFIFHATADCYVLTGAVREIPESKALKWGYNYCNECIEANS